jgi:hypothetical protein
MSDSIIKQCRKCGKEKDQNKKCKYCSSIYHHKHYLKNRNNIIERVRKYAEKNKSKIKDLKHKLYLKNREKILLKTKEYATKNQDKIKEYLNKNREIRKEKRAPYYRLWREKNKDKILEHQREYAAKNKDKKSQYDQLYRASNKNKIRDYLYKYYRDNDQELKIRSRNHGKINREILSDSYVRNILRDAQIYNPESWLIEAKRQQILLNRKLKHNQREELL